MLIGFDCVRSGLIQLDGKAITKHDRCGMTFIENRGSRAKSGEMQVFLGSLQCQLFPHHRLGSLNFA